MSDPRPPTPDCVATGADRRAELRMYLLRVLAGLTNPLVPSTHLPLPPAPSILVIRPDHLGDLLFSTPTLATLRQALPDARITCLVGPWAAEIVARNPHVDQVLTLSFPWFDRRPKRSPWGPYRLLLREASRLRGHHFDLALILRFDHWWGALLAYLGGIPRRIGYDLPETRPFLTRYVPYVPDRHEVLQNLDLIYHGLLRGPEERPSESLIGTGGNSVELKGFSPEFLGVPRSSSDRRDLSPKAFRLEFHPTAGEQARMTAWLAARGVGAADPLVGLVPGSGAPVKRWRPEAFARVGDELAQRHDAWVVITGSAGERPLAQQIAAQMRVQALVAAGETTLGELAALLGRCRVVVGVDGGPMHLAVAQGVPTVHLFGPVDPARFGPWGNPERHRVVTLEPRLPCMFCNRLDYGPEELPEHPCVRHIPVEAVLTAADVAAAAQST